MNSLSAKAYRGFQKRNPFSNVPSNEDTERAITGWNQPMQIGSNKYKILDYFDKLTKHFINLKERVLYLIAKRDNPNSNFKDHESAERKLNDIKSRLGFNEYSEDKDVLDFLEEKIEKTRNAWEEQFEKNNNAYNTEYPQSRSGTSNTGSNALNTAIAIGTLGAVRGGSITKRRHSRKPKKRTRKPKSFRKKRTRKTRK